MSRARPALPRTSNPTPPPRRRSARRSFGTPDDIRRYLTQWESTGVDQILLLPQNGNVPHEAICESQKLFFKEVMPEFRATQRKAPEGKGRPACASDRTRAQTQEAGRTADGEDHRQSVRQIRHIQRRGQSSELNGRRRKGRGTCRVPPHISGLLDDEAAGGDARPTGLRGL